MWVLDHLADLVSDFSAVHGITDITALPGPVFFSLAYRVACYPGVMQARVAGGGARPAQAVGGQWQAPPDGPGVRVVPPSQAAIQADPVFSRWFSFGTPGDAG